MEKIDNLKLALDPKTMELIVTADVVMKNKEDFDDLYLIMFNIMDDPLRLSVKEFVIYLKWLWKILK